MKPNQRDELQARLSTLTARRRELVERVAAERARSALRIAQRSEGMDRVAASFEQERIWFMDKLVPYRSVYYVPIAVRVRGRLDAGALRHSLSRIVERHEVLRTVFEESGMGPVQVIQPPREQALPVEDLRDEARPEEEARLRASAALADAFDLTAGPLLRTRLYRIADDEHVLVLTQHHIVSDFWSLGIFFGELAHHYAAALGKPLGPLPDLSIQYADFALWQREALRPERIEELIAYWREHLAGSPDLIELPIDRRRPRERRAQGRFSPLRFDGDLIEAARTLGRGEGATLHMTLMAAFVGLLARYSRDEDIVVGVPIAGRSHSELHPLIGYFLNWLAIRTHVGDDPSFRELLWRVRDAAVGAYAHQDLPFESLVQALQPRRSLSTTPIFQVTFSLRDDDLEPPRLEGLETSFFPLSGSATHFDLMADLWLDGDGVAGNLPYNEDLFEGETVARLGRHFRTLLHSAIGAPDRQLSALPLLNEHERQSPRTPPTAPSHPPDGRCLHERFEAEAARHADAVAVSFEDEHLTYAQLDTSANRLAHLLRLRGARPETVVALCLERSLETVVSILAVMKSGAAYLPLDPDDPVDRLRSVLSNSEAVLVVSSSDLEFRLPQERPPTILLDLAEVEISASPAEKPAVPVEPANAAYVIMTSGSTGNPKGVVVSHANVTALMDATSTTFAFGASDVWTLFHAYSFDFSVWELWGALLHGGRLVVVPYWITRAPDAFLTLLAEEHVTVLNQTPSAFSQLQTLVLERSEVDLSLRLVVFGGEALHPESLRPWLERFGSERPRLVNMYGITETTVHATLEPLHAPLEETVASPIGTPIFKGAAYVLDRHLEPVPPGVPGELYLGGPGVARGYLGEAALTAGRFVPDPVNAAPGARMYRTGDLVRRLASGGLAYLRRVDEQVKLRGYRVELGEIRAALLQDPGVADCAVVAVEDAAGDKQLAAYVAPRNETRPDAQQLRRLVESRLPAYMVPRTFVVLESLPLTRNGKLDLRGLPEPLDARPGREQVYVAPQTHEEKLLAGIWAEVLKLERVGVDDNFFDLGGHSLMAVQVFSKIRSQTGGEFPIVLLFQHPSLKSLAAALATASAGFDGAPELRTATAGEILEALSDIEVDALLNYSLEADASLAEP